MAPYGRLPVDKLGALHLFVRVAEAGSFVLAGRQAGLSPSAVGKAIARLESRLHVRLFHRNTRSIALTVDGVRFLERCRRILAELDAAEQELSQSNSDPRGRLRVSLPLVGMLMMPTLAGFMRRFPAIELDLDFTDRLVDVVKEGFDVVVRTGAVDDSQLLTRTLGSFSHRLVASPAYLAGRGTPDLPERLTGHACLHHRYPTTGRLSPWRLHRAGAAIDIELPKTAVASAIEPLVFMAEEGIGIAFLPEYAVRRQLDEGRLVALLDDHVDHQGVLRALWPSAGQTSPKVRVFVDYLAANLLRPRPESGGETG